MAHIDVRDLGRLTAIGAVLARHGFGGLFRSAIGARAPELAEATSNGEAGPATAPWAVRVRSVLVELGPTFVKLGQVLSVRPDIVPQALIDELRTLQDDVPPEPWDAVRPAIEEELARPIDTFFESFEPTCVASASIAQVHFAVLRDGSPVAVKVQRPGIRQVIRSDLHILYTLAHLVEGQIQLPGVYTPVAIVQEFESAILQELDFLQEASAAERFRKNFEKDPGIGAPRVHRPLCSSRLLVMDRVVGTPLSALTREDKRTPELMRRLVDATLRQVFDHGFFHGDPHPGNLFCTEDGRLLFLDFGLCGTLTAEMRDVLVTSLASLVFQDAETLALTIYRVGGLEGHVDLRAFRSEIERLMHKYRGASLRQLSTHASLVEVIELASRYKIRLLPEYAILARAASIIDGMLRGLLPDEDPVELVRPFTARMVSERMAPDRMANDALRMLVQAQGSLRGLPVQVQQLLTDLERGQLTIRTRDQEAEGLREAVRDAAFRLSLALCAMALLTSGALLLATWSPQPYGIPIMAVAGIFLTVTAVMLWLGLVAHTLLGEQLRLRSLRRLSLGVARFFFGGRRQ